MPINSSSLPTCWLLRGYCSAAVCYLIAAAPSRNCNCNSLPPDTVKMRLNRAQGSFTVNAAVFSNTPKRFALIKKKIHLCSDKWWAEWREWGRKRHDLFSKLLWCFPLFPLRFSLDAHYDCQWGRNCCRDTKELLKLHLWQLLQQCAVCGTKECYLKLLTENVQKKSNSAEALLLVSVCLVQHTLKYCIINSKLVQPLWDIFCLSNELYISHFSMHS